MIWAMKVSSMGCFASRVEREVREASHAIYCIGEGTRPVLFFGIVSTSLALRRGFIWIHLLDKSPGRLRRLRSAWPAFYAKLGWELVAFAKQSQRTERRFMEFFGLQPMNAEGDYAFYRSAV